MHAIASYESACSINVWPILTCIDGIFSDGEKTWKHRQQKAQLSQEKTRNSLYSSCCSNDFQGHPRSIIFISSEKAYAISY